MKVHQLLHRDNACLLLSVILTMLVLFLRDAIGINIPASVLTMVIASCMLILKYESLIPYVLFLIPLTCGIPGYIVLITLFIILLKEKNRNLRFVAPTLIIILIELINGDFFSTIYSDVNGVLSYISCTALFFYFITSEFKTINFASAIILFAIGCVFTFSVIYSNMMSQYGLAYILSGAARSGALGIEDNDVTMQLGHLALNSNNMSLLSLISTSCIICGYDSFSLNKKFLMLLAVFSFVCGIMTFSRTFILCIILWACLLFITNKGKDKYKLIFIVAFILVAFFVFFQEQVYAVIDTFSQRANEDSFRTGGGRTDLFWAYLNKWGSDIFYVILGAGVVNSIYVFKIDNFMHNGLEQILVSLGIVGFLTYCILTVRYLKLNYPSCKKLLLPCFVVFIFIQSSQLISPYFYILQVLPVLLLLKVQQPLKR